jgi:hypothetical protein
MGPPRWKRSTSGVALASRLFIAPARAAIVYACCRSPQSCATAERRNTTHPASTKGSRTEIVDFALEEGCVAAEACELGGELEGRAGGVEEKSIETRVARVGVAEAGLESGHSQAAHTASEREHASAESGNR